MADIYYTRRTNIAQDNDTSYIYLYYIDTEIIDTEMKVESFCAFNDKKGVEHKEKRTVFILAVVFLAVYTSFNSLQNLQSSINHVDGLGLLSLLCIYSTLMIFAILSPVAIRILSAKGVIILTCCVNLVYVASNFYPKQWTVLPSSIIVGAVSGFLWPAQGVYVATCAQSYTRRTSKDKSYVLGKFYSTFSTIYVASGITGNLLSSLLLSLNFYKSEQNDMSRNTSTFIENASLCSNHSSKNTHKCGANYCPMFNEENQKQLMLPSEASLFYLLGTFLLCVLIGFFLALFFLPPLPSAGQVSASDKKSVKTVALSCGKIQINTNLLYLCPAFFVYGWTQSFKWTDITQAYISCDHGVRFIGYLMAIHGVCLAVSTPLVSRLAKIVGREKILVILYMAYTGILATYLFLPPDTQIYWKFLILGIQGAIDGPIGAQLQATVGLLFQSQKEAAFANMGFWRSFSKTVYFAISRYVCVKYKIMILIALYIVTIPCFLRSEFLFQREVSSQKESTNSPACIDTKL